MKENYPNSAGGNPYQMYRISPHGMEGFSFKKKYR